MKENPTSLLPQVTYFIMPLFDEKNFGGLGTFINTPLVSLRIVKDCKKSAKNICNCMAI